MNGSDDLSTGTFDLFELTQNGDVIIAEVRSFAWAQVLVALLTGMFGDDRRVFGCRRHEEVRES